MTKFPKKLGSGRPLCKIDHEEIRAAVIERRIKSDTKGLMYWSAMDAQAKRKTVV